MYLIDQHAAHERVLYERFLTGARASKPDVQPLLEPLTLELSAPHRALLGEHAEAFERLGFDVEHFGDAAYVVRAAPSPMAGDDLARHIVELLDRMGRDELPDADRDPSHRVAASLACHAAVRAGMAMSGEEQRELLRQLEDSGVAAHVPARPSDDGAPARGRHRARVPTALTGRWPLATDWRAGRT